MDAKLVSTVLKHVWLFDEKSSLQACVHKKNERQYLKKNERKHPIIELKNCGLN